MTNRWLVMTTKLRLGGLVDSFRNSPFRCAQYLAKVAGDHIE